LVLLAPPPQLWLLGLLVQLLLLFWLLLAPGALTLLLLHTTSSQLFVLLSNGPSVQLCLLTLQLLPPATEARMVPHPQASFGLCCSLPPPLLLPLQLLVQASSTYGSRNVMPAAGCKAGDAAVPCSSLDT
jgi:hypothetical protein